MQAHNDLVITPGSCKRQDHCRGDITKISLRRIRGAVSWSKFSLRQSQIRSGAGAEDLPK